MGHPSIYPTGATVYRPELAWSRYTIYQAADLDDRQIFEEETS